MAQATGEPVAAPRCATGPDPDPAQPALEHLFGLEPDALEPLPGYDPPSILDLLKDHENER